MSNNSIFLLLNSKVDFFAKHLLNKRFKGYNTLNAWKQYGSRKFSFNNGIWRSENHNDSSEGGICQTIEEFSSISFDYKLSTLYNYDFFHVRIGGKTVLKESGGDSRWHHFEYDSGKVLPNCLVEIFYSKSGFDSDGRDTVWLKNLLVNMDLDIYLQMNGWLLLHQFASSDGVVAYPYIKSINGEIESIDSIDKLDAAGITHHITSVNSEPAHIEKYYMQAYRTNQEHAYIEVPLPDGCSNVMIEYGNWAVTSVHLYIGGYRVQAADGNAGSQTYTGQYHPGDLLRISGGNIFWIKAIWVK